MNTDIIFNGGKSGENQAYRQADTVLSGDTRSPSIFRFIENSKSTLDEVRRDFSLAQFHPEDSMFLQRAVKRLSGLCADAEGSGFDSLYRVAFGLQVFLVKSFSQDKNDCFWEILNQGLEMLYSLLNRGEKDYHQSMIVADVLESFERLAFY